MTDEQLDEMLWRWSPEARGHFTSIVADAQWRGASREVAEAHAYTLIRRLYPQPEEAPLAGAE